MTGTGSFFDLSPEKSEHTNYAAQKTFEVGDFYFRVAGNVK